MTSWLTRPPFIPPTGVRSFSVRSVVRNEPWHNGLRNGFKALSDTARLQSRANAIISRATVNFSDLGSKLNRLTGYDEIESLKGSVYAREQEIKDTRAEVREAKRAYEAAVAERASCQRQVNDLLQRKSSWADADLLRFTSLVRKDHENEQAEVRAKQRSASADRQLEIQFNELMRALLNRYHEEQIWSDKIRSASTYGSLGALTLNLIVFVLAIVIVEPWKRKRLGETFEQRMIVLERENQSLMRGGMQKLEEHFEKQKQILSNLSSVATVPPTDHHDQSPPVDNFNDLREQFTPSQLGGALSAQGLRASSIVSGFVGGMIVMYLLQR